MLNTSNNFKDEHNFKKEAKLANNLDQEERMTGTHIFKMFSFTGNQWNEHLNNQIPFLTQHTENI